MGKSRDKRRKRKKSGNEDPNSTPLSKNPELAVDSFAYRKETPVWQFGKVDNDSKWGWSCVNEESWKEIVLPHLTSRESMTWAEIESQTHGKQNKTSNHEIETSKIIPEAQKRLEAMKKDDYDVLFSLRVNGEIRIWGNREERVFQIFWFDFKHEICPSIKK